MAKEGLIDHQEMERKKALVTKENLVLPKKITQNPLVLQTILNILEKKHLKIRQPMKKIAQALVKRRSLKVEATDLKTLPLKNIVKKDLKLKIF